MGEDPSPFSTESPVTWGSGPSTLLPLGFFYCSGFKEPILVPALISKVTLGISPWTINVFSSEEMT